MKTMSWLAGRLGGVTRNSPVTAFYPRDAEVRSICCIRAGREVESPKPPTIFASERRGVPGEGRGGFGEPAHRDRWVRLAVTGVLRQLVSGERLRGLHHG